MCVAFPTIASDREVERAQADQGSEPGQGLAAVADHTAGKRVEPVVRVVDQKTPVVPLHADTLANPDKLVASLRSLLAIALSPSGRGPA